MDGKYFSETVILKERIPASPNGEFVCPQCGEELYFHENADGCSLFDDLCPLDFLDTHIDHLFCSWCEVYWVFRDSIPSEILDNLR